MSIYAKIVGDNHNKYQYKLGLNLLQPGEEFNTTPECGPGGLYFCDVKNIFEWLDHGDTVCIVEPENGALVVKVGAGFRCKYKTNRLVVKSMMRVQDINTWKYLVGECNAGVNALNTLSWTASRGLFEVVKYLIEECKVNVNVSDIYALRCAASKGHLEVVKYLVEECKADVHVFENLALCLAARNGHLEVVKYLVEECKADVHAQKKWALRLAAHKKYSEVVKYLKTRC